MNDITAIIIAKNEELMIADCIDSLDFCKEIIVIDNNSSDNTAELAKRMGAKVIKDSSQSFAEKRNLGLEKALHEWILYVDADERISKELKENILKAVRDDSKEFAAYKLQRQNFYLGNNPWPYIEQLERLFRKSHLRKWYGALHESPKVEGEIGVLGGYLLHYTHRDLASMLKKTIEWSKMEAQLRFESGHPQMIWWRFPRVMLTAFLNSYIKQKGYKAGTVGLIESMYQSFSIFITYARLWELQLKDKYA